MTRVKLKEQHISYLPFLQTLNNVSVIMLWHTFNIISLIPSMCQDQDSLLVKRRNDIHSPGPVIRELVPSSHQRSELSNTILCIFSRWDQRIGEGIPIPDSPGEEATFINICKGNYVIIYIDIDKMFPMRLSNDIWDWLSFCRGSNSEKNETVVKWHLSSVSNSEKSETGRISGTF